MKRPKSKLQKKQADLKPAFTSYLQAYKTLFNLHDAQQDYMINLAPILKFLHQ
ncbi:hypothetical protein DSO57_1013027 [Entomophthora muscae]|uniref:Uncharacterized protein n=1 Tax=Entomophthora muscae TaxID=34485 RepID=A0ACC2S7V3_9FUNG|nr:hypothetical protein DSO57_1013027 [Entomophthora muscae]